MAKFGFNPEKWVYFLIENKNKIFTFLDNYIFPEDLEDPAEIRQRSVLKNLLSDLRHDKIAQPTKNRFKYRQKPRKKKGQRAS